MGCTLDVAMENGKVSCVTGATCKRGITYAELECTNPTRMITSTVPVRGGTLRMVPVKTERAIPKSKIVDCLHGLKGIRENIELVAPVSIGDVIVPNICGTGVDIVATRNVYVCML